MWLQYFVPGIITSFLVKEVRLLSNSFMLLLSNSSMLPTPTEIDYRMGKVWNDPCFQSMVFVKKKREVTALRESVTVSSRRKARTIFSNNVPVISLL